MLTHLRGYSDNDFFLRLFQYKICPITQKSGKESLTDQFNNVDVLGGEDSFICVF